MGGKAGKLNKIVIGSKGGKSNIMVVLFFTAVVVSSVYGKQGEKLFISYYLRKPMTYDDHPIPIHHL